ncbi:MAG: hypothetical protein AB7W28_10250 [Armatimonadota bacterium]
MKLAARLVLVATGCVHLAAVFAGRIASHLGANLVVVLSAEALGGLLGLIVGAIIFSLGRRRRPLEARVLSDEVCSVLGLVWLVLAAVSILGVQLEVAWVASGVVWLVAVLTAVAGALSKESRPDDARAKSGRPRQTRPTRNTFHWPDE